MAIRESEMARMPVFSCSEMRAMSVAQLKIELFIDVKYKTERKYIRNEWYPCNELSEYHAKESKIARLVEWVLFFGCK
jgi:hypothetical protein